MLDVLLNLPVWLLNLPVWYWLLGTWMLTAVVAEAHVEVWDGVLNVLSGLLVLVILTACFVLWPVTLAFSVVDDNLRRWQPRRGEHRTPAEILSRWSVVPRGFGRAWPSWMIAGQWFPALTTHPVAFVPRRACVVDGWTVTLNVLIVQVAVTRLFYSR